MSLRLVTEESLAESTPPSLARRFWALVPARSETGDFVGVVEHLLVIFERFNALESSRDRESTIAALSLDTLLRQQEMQGDQLYASPEQLCGEMLTERSLVFTVGVLLFERLCDRHPFGAGQNPLALVRMRKAELGSSVNFIPRLPRLLRSILTRALSPLPEERFANLDEFAKTLAWFVDEERRSSLPGAPPIQTDASVPVFSRFSGRPISAFERAEQAGDDELLAPGLDDLDPHQRLAAASVGGTPDERQALRLRRQSELLTRQNVAPDADVDVVTEAVPVLAEARPSHAPSHAEVETGADTDTDADAKQTLVRIRAEQAPKPAVVTRRPRRLPTAAWFAMGVGATTAAFAIWTSAQPKPVVANEPVLEASPVEVMPADPVDPHPEPSVAIDGATKPEVTPLPQVTFEPERAADEALSAARSCFADVDARGLSFGVSMLFEPFDTAVQKIYFPVQSEIDWEYRKCLHEVLARVSAGVAPATTTAIELRMTIREQSSHVEIKRVRGPEPESFAPAAAADPGLSAEPETFAPAAAADPGLSAEPAAAAL